MKSNEKMMWVVIRAKQWNVEVLGKLSVAGGGTRRCMALRPCGCLGDKEQGRCRRLKPRC